MNTEEIRAAASSAAIRIGQERIDYIKESYPKEYWNENNLLNFHTVDEFINGDGLIPSDIYNE